MVYLGPNLDQIYYLHFCFKKLYKTSTPKMKKPLGNVGSHFPTLMKMCLNLETSFKHAPSLLFYPWTQAQVKVMTRMKSIIFSLKNILDTIYLKYLSK